MAEAKPLGRMETDLKAHALLMGPVPMGMRSRARRRRKADALSEFTR